MMTPIINNFLSVSHSSLQTTMSQLNDILVQQLTPLQQKTAVAAFACLAFLSMGLIACRRAWFATKIEPLASLPAEKIKTPLPQRTEEKRIKTPLPQRAEEIMGDGSPEVKDAPADQNSEESEPLVEKSEIKPDDKTVNDQVEEPETPSTPLQGAPREPQEPFSAVIKRKLLPSDGQQKAIFQALMTPVASLKSMYAELTASPEANYRRTHATSQDIQQAVESDQAALEISPSEKHVEETDILLEEEEESQQPNKGPATPVISHEDRQTEDATKDDNREKISTEPQDESLLAHSELGKRPVENQHESAEKKADESSDLPKPEIIAEQNKGQPQPKKVLNMYVVKSTSPSKISRTILERIEKLNKHEQKKEHEEQASHPTTTDQPKPSEQTKTEPLPLRHYGRERAPGPQNRRAPSKLPRHIALGVHSATSKTE